jgi:hypothetical protein
MGVFGVADLLTSTSPPEENSARGHGLGSGDEARLRVDDLVHGLTPKLTDSLEHEVEPVHVRLGEAAA